ncbi:MAG: hypothetical protein AB8F74_17040 [Saprospiraceae bacterium]
MIKKMKVLTYSKAALAFVLLLCAITAQANSGFPIAKKEFTKKIEKTYNISSDGTVDLNNRYGQVTVKSWDKNKVEIEVMIKVNSKNEESARETFERINIEFTNSSDYVGVATHIESKSSSSWVNWLGGNSSDDYSISYLVHMPSSNNITLANKYGNSTVESIEGNANMTIKYGNIDMENIGGDLNFNLGYGNATMGSCGDADVTIKYSNLKMNTAKSMRLETKYSKVKIEEATNIRSESKYDTYTLGRIQSLSNEGKYDHFNIERLEELEIETKYTDVDVDELTRSADVSMSHGGLRVRTLAPKFKNVRLEGKYTDFKIGAAGDFQLDARAEYGGIHYPDRMEVMIDKEHSSDHEIEGYAGSKSAGMIKARLEYGSLKVH